MRPGDSNLYNAEYEHRKEVFGHKFVKDFIIRESGTHFAKDQIRSWFQPSKSESGTIKQPQIPVEKSSRLLDYLNKLMVKQVDYILDIIEQKGLDFYNANQVVEEVEKALSKSESRFPGWYREFIHKTFHGIDEKAFYLFKYAYE
mmetsp:Transcript_16583/g.28229  ORF Transcript_16583/g.28229 Transcript_16583/m.28229 type:complete len:145 (+) Transcript_16583:348-782(+)